VLHFVLLRFLFLSRQLAAPRLAANCALLDQNVSAAPKGDECYDTLICIGTDLAASLSCVAFAHVCFVEQETFDVRSNCESHANQTAPVSSPLPDSGNDHRRNHFVQYVTRLLTLFDEWLDGQFHPSK
jgi:hypothetical protein